MPSIKQLQSRLLIKKSALNKVNLSIKKVDNGNNNTVSRRLNNEKGTLDSDIRKLERQLIKENKTSREKKY